MTAGHKHRTLKLRRRDSRFERVLRFPLVRSRDLEYVKRSPLVWGARDEEPAGVYTLSILGILHALTGLTLEIPDPEDAS